MYDEHRKYETCAFCDSRDLSPEHLFGRAIAKAFPVKHHWQAPRFDRRGIPVGVKKGSSPMLHVAPRILCYDHNHSLHKHMEDAKNALIPMIERHRKTFEARELQAVRRYWERVALLIDIITSNRDVSREYMATEEYRNSEAFRQRPPVYSDQTRRPWINGDRLAGLHVFVGTHEGVLGLNPGPNIAPLLSGVIPQQRHGKRVTMCIGSLTALVLVGLDDIPVPDAFIELTDNVTSLRWPRSPDVSYDDYFLMHSQTVEVVHMRRLLATRHTRRRIEQHSRRQGTFSIPGEM